MRSKRIEEPTEEEPDRYSRGGRKRRRKGGEAVGMVSPPRLDQRARGGHITAARRRELPASDFALPGHGTGPDGKGPGSYPIDTAGRARSALSRASANATPEEQKQIRAAVHRRYPSIGEA